MSDWGLSGLRSNSCQSGSAKYAPTRNEAIVVVALKLGVTSFATAVEVCPSVTVVCPRSNIVCTGASISAQETENPLPEGTGGVHEPTTRPPRAALCSTLVWLLSRPRRYAVDPPAER